MSALNKFQNPLIDRLHPQISIERLPERYASNPLAGVDANLLSVAEREDLLILRQRHFVPTETVIALTRRLHRLVRDGYFLRNPCQSENRARINKLAKLASQKDSNEQNPIGLIYPEHAAGAVIEGITGLMKSFTVVRALQLLGPQVVVHEENAITGWKTCTQLTYLIVPASTTGGVTGFLQNILHAVDELLGTTYARQYEKRKVDPLIRAVALVLATCFTGVLVIEEIQLKSLGPDTKNFSLFLLTLTNCGIPVCLVGNPLAIDQLRRFSQDVRRFSVGGNFYIKPFMSPKDPEFQEFARDIFCFSVMPHPAEINPAELDLIFQLTGGIPDFISRLNTEAQLHALSVGAERISKADLEAAYQGETFRANHSLIRGLVKRDVKLLTGLDDVPIHHFQTIWASEHMAGRGEAPANTNNDTRSISDNRQRTQAEQDEIRLKTSISKEKKKAARDQKLTETLSPSDIRNGGASENLVDALETLRERVSNSRSDS